MGAAISGKTKLYGVIGDPISHSLSPIFQNQLLKQEKAAGVYLPLRVTADKLQTAVEFLKDNFAGFNVTIPHKEKILDYLDELDKTAEEYGAVNTVKVREGRLVGYNTDGTGFINSLKDINLSLTGKKVLLLGAGGAAKVIAFEVVKQQGILTIANRSPKRAENIKAEIKKRYNTDINIADPNSIQDSFQIIINGTSVGMYPQVNACPVAAEALKDAELVYDLIYNPGETKLLRHGRSLGVKTVNGLPMLLHQGIKSFEIWWDRGTGVLSHRPELFGALAASLVGQNSCPPVPLEELRKIIDECDQQLVRIFEERLRAVLAVAAYKREHQLPILQPERESRVLKKVRSYLGEEQFLPELELLYRQILKSSRKIQSNKLFPYNIVLIGFMGSGKTSVGRELATLLEMDYLDTDQLIEKEAGMSINEIFHIRGEAGFRKLEKEVIAALKGVHNKVIACGGGAVLDAENSAVLKGNGKLVWLQASWESVYNRLLGDTARPLLKNNFTGEQLAELLENRLPVYEQVCDFKISTDQKGVAEVAEEVIAKLLR
ncbi:MAG: shikimate dehydrogenase [Bacillota bacterium]